MPLVGVYNTVLPSISAVGSTVGTSISTSNGSWSYVGQSANGFSYQWLRDGGAIGGATGSSYTLADADDQHTITCQVTAYGTAGDQATATTGNSVGPVTEPAPTGGSTSISGTGKVGNTLSGGPSGWAHMGGSSGSYAYQWKRNGSGIGGANGDSYTLTSSDDGTTITLTVTATNDGGSGSATSSGIGVTYNAPTNSVAPVIAGTAQTGMVLSVTSNGTWTNNPAFSFQWQRDNSGGGSFSNIGSATLSTYTLVQADAGCKVRCVVKGTNDGGNNSANSNQLGLVVAIPINTVPPAVTGTTTQGQTLATTNGTWLNTPTSYTYQWYADVLGNGVFAPLAGAISSTYVLQSTDVGNQIKCIVTASSATGSGNCDSNIVGRVNGPPVSLATPKVSDPVVYNESTVTCDGGTWGGYPTPTLAYQWQYSADNSSFSNITGATSYTLMASETTYPNEIIGKYVRCVVTASNGY